MVTQAAADRAAGVSYPAGDSRLRGDPPGAGDDWVAAAGGTGVAPDGGGANQGTAWGESGEGKGPHKLALSGLL